MSVLVVDVGTSSVRAGVVRPDATVTAIHRAPLPPSVPAPGLVEFDADAMADHVLATARRALDESGPVQAVGVTNQRASAVVWDPQTGRAAGPGLGWQDLRTVGTCLELGAEGIRVAPNETVTKVAWLLDAAGRDRDKLRWGTVDSWIIWHLTGGECQVTDPSNAAVTGLLASNADEWDAARADRLSIPLSTAPKLVDSSGPVGSATALAGSPPITGIVGDQQGSLVGQGCTIPGLAKVTFGTGAMLDLCLGEQRPAHTHRGEHGCFPIIAWRRQGKTTWGVEAIMLSAGSAVDWLVEDLGLLSSADESEAVAATCPDSGGVMHVPALVGLGTPQWDFGARGTLLGLTRGTTRAQLVRAVLEGIAGRGADLVEAAEADSGRRIGDLRVDGGMSGNATFLQALADATGRVVEVSPEREATTLGAGLLAGMAVGMWRGEEDVAATWRPRAKIQPTGQPDRERWREAVNRSRSWYPELSALHF